MEKIDSIAHLQGWRGLCVVDQGAVDRLRGQLRNQSKECVMDTLGISANTWTKLKRGEPVRWALVKRAIARLPEIPSMRDNTLSG
jgi:hypothetical protein